MTTITDVWTDRRAWDSQRPIVAGLRMNSEDGYDGRADRGRQTTEAQRQTMTETETHAKVDCRLGRQICW